MRKSGFAIGGGHRRRNEVSLSVGNEPIDVGFRVTGEVAELGRAFASSVAHSVFRNHVYKGGSIHWHAPVAVNIREGVP